MSTGNQSWTTELTSRDRRTRRNSLVFTFWLLLFAGSFLAGHWLLRYLDWTPEGAIGIGYSLLPLIPGLLAFRAYLKLFREADEMLRKTLVEGIVFGFGAVMLFWGTIQLPEHVWLPKVKADLVIAVMMIAWSVGTIRASWRMR